MTYVRAFYRSPLTPVSFVIGGLFIAFTLSPLGPREWRDTYSLRLIHSLIPWPVMSGLFLAYVVLLCCRSLIAVIVADCLGLGLYGIAFAAVLLTLRLDRPANPIAIYALGLACVMHLLAVRLALFDLQRRRVGGGQ